MEGACYAVYLTLALHRRKRSSLEKLLKKGRGFLTLCAILVAFRILIGREIAGPQLGHTSVAGDNVEILPETTGLRCLVGCASASSKMG